jgi:uncharacterized Zn-binding protein involved in type VI secretion
MSKPAARLSDVNTAGGPIVSAVSTNVLINGRPAATVGSVVAPHFPYKKIHKMPTYIVTGSPSVLVNGKPLAHMGSNTICGHTIATGAVDVLVGSGGIGIGGGAANPYESPEAQELVRQNGPAAIGLDQPPDTPTTSPEPADCGGFLNELTTADYNKKISNNFTLGDFSIRARAGQHYIKAQHGLTVQQICCSLSALAKNIGDPLRVKYPQNFSLNSGFRAAKNGSDHERGLACDIQWAGISAEELLARCQWAVDNLPFWQIIYEKPPSSSFGWMHIAYNGGKRISGKPPVLSWFGSNYIQGLVLRA